MEQTKEKQKKKMPRGAKIAIIIVSIVLVLAILATVTVGAAIGLIGVLFVGGAAATVGALIYFDVFSMDDLEEFFLDDMPEILEEFFMDDIPEFFEELFSEIKGYFIERPMSFEEIYGNLEKIATEDIELDKAEGEEETRALLSECFDEAESIYNGPLFRGLYCENEGDGEWWCIVAFECGHESGATELRNIISENFYDEDWANITYHIEGSVLLVGTSQDAINMALGEGTHINTDTNVNGGHNHNSSNTNTDEKPNNGTNTDINTNICNHSYDNDCDSACNSCGEEREVPHNMSCMGTIEPTCASEGYDVYECPYCHLIERRNFTAPNPNVSDHSFEFVVVVSPTCESGGYGHYFCSECGTQAEGEWTIYLPLGHNYDNGYCTVCGCEQIELYTRVDDDTILFGEYPQTKVTDSTEKATLNSLAGTLPTSENEYDWTSYGYYINGSVSNFMWYIDVESGGERYRGVYFTSYRPYNTTNSSSTSNSRQDDNGYYTSTVYWFKYEPISWTILSEINDTALIFCDMVIDSQEYYPSTSSHTVNGTTIYANNYEYSTIRKWLNETFLNTAFDELQKGIILTTTVDNSEESMEYDSLYACDNTEDKIFVLSVQEATNSEYGFTSDETRIKNATDYAKIQGVYVDTSYGGADWWMRSPNPWDDYIVRAVRFGGSTQADFASVGACASNGVVPALWIQLD